LIALSNTARADRDCCRHGLSINTGGGLGHAVVQVTAGRYGHLFPRGDDREELAAVECALLSKRI